MKGTSVGTRFRHVCRAALEHGRRARERSLELLTRVCECGGRVRVLVQTSRQESYDADHNLRIAKEQARKRERDLKCKVVQLDRTNRVVFEADRATARASHRVLTHADTVQKDGAVLVDAAMDATRGLQDALKVPLSKRGVVDMAMATQSLAKFAAAASTLFNHHNNAAVKLVESSQAVRAANSAACLAQHGAYA